MKKENSIPPNWSGDKILKALGERNISSAGIARDLDVKAPHVHRVIYGHCVSDRVRRHIALCIESPVEVIWPETYLTKKNPTRKGRPRSRGLYSGDEAAA